VASAGDLSAIYYNPAGLAQLEGTHFLVSPIYFKIKSQYTRDPGTVTVTSDKPSITGIVGFSTDLNRQDMVLGVGLYTPYGMKLDWPATGPQRYSVTRAELRAIFITPSVGYRISNRLSVGAGFSIISARAELKKKSNPFFSDPWNPISQNPDYDVDVTVEGDDRAIGADFGVRYQVHDDLAWGFFYAPETELEFEGTFTAEIPPMLQSLFAWEETFTDRGRVKLVLPHQIRTGIHWRGTERLGLEFEFGWSRWSSHETLTFDYDNTTPLTMEDTVLPRDWKNTIAIHIGVDYRVSPELILRGGYFFDQTSVPDETLDPVLPQADKNIFSGGIGYRRNNFSLDFSYAYLVNDDRTITNSILDFPTNGLYESSAHLLSLSGGYTF
jgi:long-chain fatty acid transport protein